MILKFRAYNKLTKEITKISAIKFLDDKIVSVIDKDYFCLAYPDEVEILKYSGYCDHTEEENDIYDRDLVKVTFYDELFGEKTLYGIISYFDHEWYIDFISRGASKYLHEIFDPDLSNIVERIISTKNIINGDTYDYIESLERESK